MAEEQVSVRSAVREAVRPLEWSSVPGWHRADVVVVNVTRGAVLADRIWVARNALTRLIGVAGRSRLVPGQALLLPGTRAVHTCFLAFPIDLVLFDRAGIVLEAVSCLPPWSLSPYRLRAAGAVELPAGTLQRSGTAPGDQLLLAPSRRLARLRRQSERGSARGRGNGTG